MTKALVTGASSGIGEAIAFMLLEKGYEVVGIAREFDKSKLDDKNYTKLKCDLENFDKSLLAPYIKNTSVLVNAAGVGEFGEFRESEEENIEKVISTNLLAPIRLTHLLIDELINQKGFIFNITSVEATRCSKLSSIYTASKAGLRAFSLSLFEEIREKGVKVVSINPDITDTNFFDNLFFTISNKKNSFLLPQQIADIVKYSLDLGENACLSDITIRPQVSKISRKDR